MDGLFLISIISMASLAVIFSAILAFADKKLRVEEDPTVTEVLSHLPGLNCGACGCLSCHDFAENVVKEGVDPARCRVMSEESKEKICGVIGRQGGEVYPKLPIVKCAAEWDEKKSMGDYKGVRTCNAANLVFGSGMECEYGCIGFGDCAEVCPFDALHMINGLPVVDPAKCAGCGKCAEACPRDIIRMEEKKHEKLFYVACSSHDNMIRTRQVCGVGCMACGVCVKLSGENGYFKLEDNLSFADYSKQGDQEAIKAIQPKCPTKVIKDI